MTRRLATQFINDTIYSLKREYGFPLTIFKKVSSSINIETGVVSNVLLSQYIRRAVLLPRTLIREIFKVEYDSNSRLIIIDYNDLDDFTVAKDDYIVFNSKKYLVNEIIVYDYGAAVMLNVKESLGSGYAEAIPESVITFDQSVTGAV